MDEYCVSPFNERVSTILDNTGATGLVREPQLELTAILRVRIECHRSCYVITIGECNFDCYEYNYSLIARKYMRLPILI